MAHMHGPGSNSAPRSASAMTDTAPLRPCRARAPRLHLPQRPLCMTARPCHAVLSQQTSRPQGGALGCMRPLLGACAARSAWQRPSGGPHLGDERGAVQGVDGDVHLGVRRAVADVLAAVQHGRLRRNRTPPWLEDAKQIMFFACSQSLGYISTQHGIHCLHCSTRWGNQRSCRRTSSFSPSPITTMPACPHAMRPLQCLLNPPERKAPRACRHTATAAQFGAPSIFTVLRTRRIISTAAWSAAFLSPCVHHVGLHKFKCARLYNPSSPLNAGSCKSWMLCNDVCPARSAVQVALGRLSGLPQERKRAAEPSHSSRWPVRRDLRSQATRQRPTLPNHLPDASAAASVTRTSSSARLRWTFV